MKRTEDVPLCIIMKRNETRIYYCGEVGSHKSPLTLNPIIVDKVVNATPSYRLNAAR